MKIKILIILFTLSLPVSADICISPLQDTLSHSHGNDHSFGYFTPVLSRGGFRGDYVSFFGSAHQHQGKPPTIVHEHHGHKGEHAHKPTPRRRYSGYSGYSY